MTYSAQIVEDSISPGGVRLTTLQLRYPRMVHAEFMTHRVFSRNASSSRAIPVKKLIQDVIDDPAEPIFWGKNQPGMQAREELDEGNRSQARAVWYDSLNFAVESARRLSERYGAHKQIANRLLEPFAHINIVVTATEWDNFLWLRDHSDAQPEIQELAKHMRRAIDDSQPIEREVHLPYVLEDERDGLSMSTAMMVSAARCARVSYMTHENKKPEFDADFKLAQKLKDPPPHLSPFEHPAEARDPKCWFANFRGWESDRHMSFGGASGPRISPMP